MKYALVDNFRVEPAKGLKGFCPACCSPMISRCGDQRVHHWAHKNGSLCDRWWENETDWHRQWKNKFPKYWQEKVFTNKTNGEKHIADVHTVHGLTVEFQHSHIKPEERIAREQFYDNLLWIVDGTRLKQDYPRFRKNIDMLRRTDKQGQFIIDHRDKCFPLAWTNCKVPVIFDFRVNGDPQDSDELREYLICLMPSQGIRESVVYFLTVDSFVNNVQRGSWFNKNPDDTSILKNNSSRKPRTMQRSPYVIHRGRLVRKKRL